MDSFKVVPVILSNKLPTEFQLRETLLEFSFRIGLGCIRRVGFKRCYCPRNGVLCAAFSILGMIKRRRELCRDGTEDGKAVRHCVLIKIAAQNSKNALVHYPW